MITIKIVPQNNPILICRINQEPHEFKTNIDSSYKENSFVDSGHLCIGNKLCRTCTLLESLYPICLYFSEIISHEKVTFRYEAGDMHIEYKEPAQNACLTLMIYAFFYSRCPFFSRFLFLLKYYPPRITHDIYLHMLLTTIFFSREINFANSERINIYERLKQYNTDLKSRLSKLMGMFRSLQHEDAAVNSLTIAFALILLSEDEIEEKYKEFSENIHNILKDF